MRNLGEHVYGDNSLYSCEGQIVRQQYLKERNEWIYGVKSDLGTCYYFFENELELLCMPHRYYYTAREMFLRGCADQRFKRLNHNRCQIHRDASDMIVVECTAYGKHLSSSFALAEIEHVYKHGYYN